MWDCDFSVAVRKEPVPFSAAAAAQQGKLFDAIGALYIAFCPPITMAQLGIVCELLAYVCALACYPLAPRLLLSTLVASHFAGRTPEEIQFLAGPPEVASQGAVG